MSNQAPVNLHFNKPLKQSYDPQRREIVRQMVLHQERNTPSLILLELNYNLGWQLKTSETSQECNTVLGFCHNHGHGPGHGCYISVFKLS